jgi:hypothetical protein
MKRIAMAVALALLAAGCATSSSVKKEIDPLAARITALEQKQAVTDQKLAQMSAKDNAQTAEIQALRKEVADSTAATHDAVMRAEAAAQKSTKAFELMQVKGTKGTKAKAK